MANLVHLCDNEVRILQEWAATFTTRETLSAAVNHYCISPAAINYLRNRKCSAIRMRTYELLYEVLMEGARRLGLPIPDRLLGTTTIDTGEAQERKFVPFQEPTGSAVLKAKPVKDAKMTETLRNVALDVIAEADGLRLRKLVAFMLTEQML